MKQVLIAADQLVNAIFGGWADETLSARVWRNQGNSWYWKLLLKVIDGIFFWQDNHCQKSFDSEVLRRHFPDAYRI